MPDGEKRSKPRLKIKFGRFLKNENTLYIWWLILVYLLKKEKLDQPRF